MRNGPLFFLGLFITLSLSWAGTVLLSQHQLGALAPYYDEGESKSFPDSLSGIAARGQLVYADLGCAACHTQAVRRPDFGADQARGWGERQSVARDYIYQTHVQLGAMRLGPDLTNLAGRKPTPFDTEDLMKLLYTGMIPGTKVLTHPPYAFLFEDRKVVGEISAKALKFADGITAAPGHEIVPTERAQSLVAYLLSLNNTYDYPESRPVAPEKKDGEKHDAAAPKAAPAPGAAPAPKEEGKK